MCTLRELYSRRLLAANTYGISVSVCFLAGVPEVTLCAQYGIQTNELWHIFLLAVFITCGASM